MAELTWQGKQNKDTILESRLQHAKHTPTSLVTREIIGHPMCPETTFPNQVWHNRLIHGNTLDILPALLPEFESRVQLIYIDPPFMTERDFKNDSQLFYSDRWNQSLDFYLSWLYEILILLHRLLSENGSLYVHLDWRTIHYVKVLLDEIFHTSEKWTGFQNEIIWHYQSGGRSSKHYARKHDTILLYTKSDHYCFHPERIGERRGTQKRNHMRKRIGTDGRTSWTIRSGGRVYTYDEDSFMTPSDVWHDISHLHQRDPERNGYATQKPAALLERILLASSETDDLVLDCFCGSGVTPFVAQTFHRRWIACDQSEPAISLTRQRLDTCDQLSPYLLQACSRQASG
jgi:site-specific DNA-methyltransferase (adenine-specific)/adenine-specific DNA-methyltransferase